MNWLKMYSPRYWKDRAAKWEEAHDELLDRWNETLTDAVNKLKTAHASEVADLQAKIVELSRGVARSTKTTTPKK